MSICLSVIALALSIHSTALSYLVNRHQFQFTARVELTTVINRLAEIQVSNQKSIEEHRGDASSVTMQMAQSWYIQEYATLAQQGRILADLIPELTTDLDFNTLALAFAMSGQYEEAEAMYARAMDRAPSPQRRAMGLRSRAGIHFWLGRYEEARKEYRESLALVNKNDDDGHLFNGFTLQSWGTNARAAGFCDEAKGLFIQARAMFEQLSNPATRAQQLDSLEAAIATPVAGVKC